MQISIIETSGLGDRSYVVSDGNTAVVIDPQRDIDRVLNAVGDARITHVLETHIHNDYVSGGLELSRVVDAEYVVPDGEDLGYPAHRVVDGDTVGVFTGGSLLFGSTGRTDLVDEAQTETLTRAQYRSVRRLADALPDGAQVYPTHGFGSFCSASSVDEDSSTIGQQRHSNPALTKNEQDFVDELLTELSRATPDSPPHAKGTGRYTMPPPPKPTDPPPDAKRRPRRSTCPRPP